MMGVGKSYIGLGASKILNARFLDLDHLIRQQKRKSISDIFKESGETGFRQVENQILKSIPIEADRITIIACGGGTPVFHDNLAYMKQTGTIIWLYMPIEMIVDRLRQATDDRPMLKATQHADFEKNINQMYTNRVPKYEESDFTINAVGHDDDIIAQLVALIRAQDSD